MSYLLVAYAFAVVLLGGFLAYSLIRDPASIQQDNNEILRAVSDSLKAKLRPPLVYDENLVSRALMNRLDPRQEGQTVALNMQMGDAVKTLIPPEYYNIDPRVFEHVSKQEERIDHLMGVRDFAALAKARQIPSGDAVEKIFELVGPIVTDSSRNMERSLRDLGEQWKSMAFQFYTTPRKVQILGEDAVDETDYDFDPGNMIPSHVPGEEEAEARGEPSRLSRLERARFHQNSFYFHVTPNSLHQITQMSRKLLYLQLWKAQYPIDPWTVGDAIDLPNFGPPPPGTKNIIERWVAWKHMLNDLAKEGVQPGGPGRQGRPSSGHAPPRVQPKDGGQRTTMAESR